MEHGALAVFYARGMRTTRSRVRLREVVPEVLRVIDVPATSTLAELHALLQTGVGWTDSHLHQFVAGDARYGVPHEDSWDEARSTRPAPA